jgi:hypothetical protein
MQRQAPIHDRNQHPAHQFQVVHEEGAIAAAARDALRAAEVEVNRIHLVLHVPRRRQHRVGIVAAELHKQRPASGKACCIRSLMMMPVVLDSANCDVVNSVLEASLRVSDIIVRWCSAGAHLSPAQVVKCSALYFASSEKMRACSMGVYAAVAPFWRHSMRNASSDCRGWEEQLALAVFKHQRRQSKAQRQNARL